MIYGKYDIIFLDSHITPYTHDYDVFSDTREIMKS